MSQNSENIVIVGASRTPMGGFQGCLSSVTAPDLGSRSIAAALDQTPIEKGEINEVLMGCVLPAGQGQAPARQASLGAGIPMDVPCTTLNKMCGSGMKTVMMAYDQLQANNGEIVVAGGMESMSNAPYILPKMRSGARLGHDRVLDHMFIDGLEDAYEPGRLMGTFAEDCAEKYQFTRDQQDEYALGSLSNALKAQEEGRFKKEITSVTVKTRKETVEIDDDEQPKNARPDKIPNLKPAFKKRRYRNRCQCLFNLRRCCGPRSDARKGCPETGYDHSCRNSGPRDTCPGTELVHDSSHTGDQEGSGKNRLAAIGRGSLGNQRGLRRGAHGSHVRNRHSTRKA